MQTETKFGQDLFWGSGALSHIPQYLKQNGVASILLVHGDASFKNAAKILSETLKDVLSQEIVIHHSLPELNKLRSIYSSIESNLPSCIIAIGGGSVIDSAKTFIHLHLKAGKIAPSLIVVPTTAGSGSEATPFAVIYEGKTKTSLETPELLPTAVFIDPLVYHDMHIQQRAISGADAWCQAIESCWSNRASPESIDLAKLAFDRIYSELPKLDQPVSLKLALGAHYAGVAIRRTYTTGAHALSYYLTAEHGVAHGQAVSVFLPVMLLYNLRGEQVTAGVSRVMKWIDANDETDAINKIMSFIRQCKLKASLKELGLKNLSIDKLADSINHQRFSNNPRPFDREALMECIEWSLNQA